MNFYNFSCFVKYYFIQILLKQLKFLIILIFPITPMLAAAEATVNSTNANGSIETATKSSNDPVVKKSLSNVCYAKSDIGYRKTHDFTPYNSLDECRNSGGRPDKHKSHQKN